jgi:threonine/homoserine/homoserine lactone efflux protein
MSHLTLPRLFVTLYTLVYSYALFELSGSSVDFNFKVAAFAVVGGVFFMLMALAFINRKWEELVGVIGAAIAFFGMMWGLSFLSQETFHTLPIIADGFKFLAFAGAMYFLYTAYDYHRNYVARTT